MMIARRTTALALTDVAISSLVFLIHMEPILLAIAYPISEAHGEPFSFHITLDKLNHMIGTVPS